MVKQQSFSHPDCTHFMYVPSSCKIIKCWEKQVFDVLK